MSHFGVAGRLGSGSRTHSHAASSAVEPRSAARYGEQLAGPAEKQDYVDAYAAQHPGAPAR